MKSSNNKLIKSNLQSQLILGDYNLYEKRVRDKKIKKRIFKKKKKERTRKADKKIIINKRREQQQTTRRDGQ